MSIKQGRSFCFISISLLVIFFISTSLSYGGSWKPYQFQVGERYEFKISMGEEAGGDETRETIYILEINDFPEKENAIEVSFTTKFLLEKEDLSYEKVFGFGEIIGVPFSILIVNPMYSLLFEQVDLDVGEKMKILGFGTVKVTGKENVSGREGFVCQLFQVVENKEELVVEWVIDPNLALPLRVKDFREGNMESLFELISYESK